jgi:hypothetical protein
VRESLAQQLVVTSHKSYQMLVASGG